MRGVLFAVGGVGLFARCEQEVVGDVGAAFDFQPFLDPVALLPAERIEHRFDDALLGLRLVQAGRISNLRENALKLGAESRQGGVRGISPGVGFADALVEEVFGEKGSLGHIRRFGSGMTMTCIAWRRAMPARGNPLLTSTPSRSGHTRRPNRGQALTGH
ncbi:hypothetical protein [Pseudorhodoplanes sp.]|uniref:hypothetical protein n=1 Tax=Pseudorhodoplanes sp. TaxID=1934341 RepID=UPI00391CAD71